VWGAGHGTGVLILGSLGIFAKSALDIETLSAYSEGFVGFMLLGIGLWAAHKTVLLQRSGASDSQIFRILHAPALSRARRDTRLAELCWSERLGRAVSFCRAAAHAYPFTHSLAHVLPRSIHQGDSSK
jgi:hypothetical protein